MLSPRSIICTADRAAARAWAGPLSAVGSRVDVVETCTAIEGKADLVLAHASGDITALAQPLSSAGEGASVVVVPDLTLSAVLQAMRIPSVRVVVSQDYVDPRLLTYISSKLVRGDIFGLSKVMPWGVHIHSQLVNNHEERTQALASTMQFAKAMGVRGKYREAIELVADELLMNALYNAPVGPEGPLFVDVAPKDRSALRLERPAILQMACDGGRFALSVRDSFGSLRAETILAYLERCLTTTDQIDRKVSGAGLGLYLVANNVTEFIANILPNTATEVICVFDVRAPGQQLRHIGIYQESFARYAEMRESRKQRLVGSASAPPADKMSRIVPLTLATAIVLLFVAGFLLVWPFVAGPGKGNLKVTVQPPGATVYVNGIRRGVASPALTVKDLEVNTPYEVTARRPGFRDSQEVITVARGSTSDVNLSMRQLKARVRVTSSPSGAAIWLDGKQIGQRTPALLEKLEPDHQYKVRLVKHGYIDSAGVFTPSAEETLLYHVNLPLAQSFAQLSIQSKPPGARLWINNVDTGQSTPFTGHVLRSGQEYAIKVVAPNRVPWEETIRPKKGDQIKRELVLPPGGAVTITANVPGRVYFDNEAKGALPFKNQMIAEGSYRVRIRDDNPYVDHGFNLAVKAGTKNTRHLLFGFVTVNKKKGLKIKVNNTLKVGRIALPPGRQRVVLVDPKTGQTRTETIVVAAKRTTVVD